MSDRVAVSGIDFFSRCFGCGKEFTAGDRRLRFSLNEWERYEGLDETPDVDIEVGLCDACIEEGDFKQAEIVA